MMDENHEVFAAFVGAMLLGYEYQVASQDS